MVAYNIQFGQGITVGGGIGIGAGTPGASFSLSSTDFTNTNVGGYITSNGNTGFTTTGQGGPGWAFWEPKLSLNNGGNPAKLAELRAYWASNYAFL
jgi:hypothetical protein